MIDIRPFRHEDFDVLFDLANQAYPSPKENAVWFERRKTFDESKQIRRHCVATDASLVVGYGCLEQQSDDSKTLRIFVVCSPANMRSDVGEGLYLRLLQDAKELGATTLWAREYQDDENIRVFLTSRGFVQGHPYTLPDHAPLIMYKLELEQKN